jgi:hypothetical protein
MLNKVVEGSSVITFQGYYGVRVHMVLLVVLIYKS